MRWPSITPRRILLGAWLVFLLATYPGFMRTDAADELVDSRVGVFTDWHVPMMSQVWRIVGIVFSGPAGMLLLQSALLLGGTFVLARRLLAERAAAIVAACALLFPPLLIANGLVTAEAQLAGFLIAGAAAFTCERRWVRILGLVLVVLGCSMHDAGPLAALPIVVGMFVWDRSRPRWQRIGIAIAAWVLVVGVALGLSHVVVDDRSYRNEVAFAMSDIVGTLRYAGTLDDATIERCLPGVRFATADIQQRARAIHGRTRQYAATDQRLFEPPTTDAEREALFAGRRALVRLAPKAYLKARWGMFVRTIGWRTPSNWSPAYTAFYETFRDAKGMYHAARHSLLQGLLLAPFTALSGTPLFRPYLYLALALLLLPFAIVRRQRAAIVFLASALGYELGVFVLANRTDYRDAHWLMVATVLGLALVVTRRWQRPASHEQTAAPPPAPPT